MTSTVPSVPRAALLLGFAAFVIVAGALGGCAPSRAKSHLDVDARTAQHAAITSSDGPVTFSVLPYTSAMDESAFGVDLQSQGQMAVELKVETGLGGSSPVAILFRRQDVQLVFKDGTRRYPLDPLKVYEEHRVDKTAAATIPAVVGAAAFGPAGVVVAGIAGHLIAGDRDDSRREVFGSAALDEVRLDDVTRSSHGFLFFDRRGIPQSQISALRIEYENVVTAEVRAVEIPL